MRYIELLALKIFVLQLMTNLFDDEDMDSWILLQKVMLKSDINKFKSYIILELWAQDWSHMTLLLKLLFFLDKSFVKCININIIICSIMKNPSNPEGD